LNKKSRAPPQGDELGWLANQSGRPSAGLPLYLLIQLILAGFASDKPIFLNLVWFENDQPFGKNSLAIQNDLVTLNPINPMLFHALWLFHGIISFGEEITKTLTL
jgi:hypothetical protein